MKFEILQSSDLFELHRYYNMLPEILQDVFISPEYVCHSEANGKGQAVCLILKDEHSLYYFPFIKVPIDNPEYDEFSAFSDIQGTYGYSGIFTKNPTKELTIRFNEFIHDYAINASVISAFIRCNPVYGNHIYFDPTCIQSQMENVILDLMEEDIFNRSYEYSTRKNIRKAEREGIFAEVFRGVDLNDNQLRDYIMIYNATMDRNNADQFYYFSPNYFKTLFSDLKDRALVFVAYKEDKPVSVELILLNSYVGYSFLGGTMKEYYQYRPNDFLKHYIINFLKKIGCSYYCLGGGPEGVLRFKKTFAREGARNFMVYKKIFNEDIYTKINQKWKSLYPARVLKFDTYFQKYRF